MLAFLVTTVIAVSSLSVSNSTQDCYYKPLSPQDPNLPELIIAFTPKHLEPVNFTGDPNLFETLPSQIAFVSVVYPKETFPPENLFLEMLSLDEKGNVLVRNVYVDFFLANNRGDRRGYTYRSKVEYKIIPIIEEIGGVTPNGYAYITNGNLTFNLDFFYENIDTNQDNIINYLDTPFDLNKIRLIADQWLCDQQ